MENKQESIREDAKKAEEGSQRDASSVKVLVTSSEYKPLKAPVSPLNKSWVVECVDKFIHLSIFSSSIRSIGAFAGGNWFLLYNIDGGGEGRHKTHYNARTMCLTD